MAPGRLAAIERWFLRTGLFLLPVTYWWGTYDHYVLPKLLVARVLVLGLLILLLARTIATRSFSIKRTPLDLPLLAFAGSALLSTLFAYNRNVAVFGTYARYDGVLTIVMYAALYWLSAQTLRTESPSPAVRGTVAEGADDARALLRVLLASGYLVAALAIIQSVVDSLAQTSVAPAFGTLGQQNVLGAFLAMLAPLAYRELIEADSWSTRLVALNVLIIVGVALVLTLSRSAWLGVALAAIVVLAGNRRTIFRPAVVAAVVLIGLGVTGLSLSGALPLERQIQARTMSVFDFGAWGPRPAIWRDTTKLIASRPVLGYGPDNVGLVYPRFQAQYLGQQQVDKAHAETLQVAATQGLIGLAAYLLVLAAFVRAFWRGRHRPGAVAIFAGWLAYEVTLQLNFSALASSLPFWIFAAAAMQSWGATREMSFPLNAVPPPPAGEGRVGGVGRGLATTAIGALLALAIIGTAFPYLADSRLQAAVAADLDGRGDVARAAAAQAIDLAPQESVYAVEVGNIAFERSDWASAVDAYDAAARLGTYNPLVYRNLALAEINLGRFADARAAAAKAVELDRFDPANRALLAGLDARP